MVAVEKQAEPAAESGPKMSGIYTTDPVSGGDTGFYLALSEIVIERGLQTRHDRDEAIVEAIRSSMQARIDAGRHPQETPAWVVRRGTQWVLLAGFTRYELLSELAKGSSEYARRPTIWVTVKEAPTVYRAVLENMRENLDRQSLSVADEAEGYARLKKLEPTKTVADIAADTNRSASAVENLIRAYERSTPEIWSAFRRGLLPQRQVIRLAALHEDKGAQREAFERLTDPDKRREEREAAAARNAANAGSASDGAASSPSSPSSRVPAASANAVENAALLLDTAMIIAELRDAFRGKGTSSSAPVLHTATYAQGVLDTVAFLGGEEARDPRKYLARKDTSGAPPMKAKGSAAEASGGGTLLHLYDPKTPGGLACGASSKGSRCTAVPESATCPGCRSAFAGKSAKAGKSPSAGSKASKSAKAGKNAKAGKSPSASSKASKSEAGRERMAAYWAKQKQKQKAE